MNNEELKKELTKLQKIYIAAQNDHLKTEMLDYMAGKAVLQQNEFKIEDKYQEREGKILKNPKHTYMLDEESFKEYNKLHHEKMKVFGLDIPLEKTSTYLTFEKLKTAENNLLSFGKQISQEKLKISDQTYEELHIHHVFRGQILDLLAKLEL